MAMAIRPTRKNMNTIKIRLVTSVVGNGFEYPAGTVTDAPEDRAKDLLQAGYAVVEGKPQVEKAERATDKTKVEKR